ncbi:hypothetical protein BC940DRAFT_287023 [Gongronella butleri]|nr:hypothetical protein BC940DRAFT_287023 [Gongronella butleri]
MLRFNEQGKAWPDEHSAPTKKSKERLSRLFSKRGNNKPKKESAAPMPPGASSNTTLGNTASPPLSSVSRHASIRSTPTRLDSLRKREYVYDRDGLGPAGERLSHDKNKSDENDDETKSSSMRSSSDTASAQNRMQRSASLQRNSYAGSLEENNNNNGSNISSNKVALTAHELRQRLMETQQQLERWQQQREQCRHDNQRLSEQLMQQQKRLAERTARADKLQRQYQEHVKGLRATPDDLTSIKQKLTQLQQAIGTLADRLTPHISPDHTHTALASFWLNLRDVLVPMIPFSTQLTRFLTEKFISDVLMQNFALHDMDGCECAPEYTAVYQWLLDHQLDDMATDLRQRLARSIVKGEKLPNVKTRLEHTVRQHWKYLYSGLVKAYPYIYQYDTSNQHDISTHFGAQIQVLVDQAIAIGFAMKGFENDITPTAVEEGTQPLDTVLMDELAGKHSGIIQFCISPPFRLIHQPDPLLKGRVLCATSTNPRNSTASTTSVSRDQK